MVSALTSGSNGSGSSPGQGHCVMFLGKTIYLQSASLHSGVKMGTGQFNAGGLPCDGLASHPGKSVNFPGRFMLLKPSTTHLARMQTLPFTLQGLFSPHS